MERLLILNPGSTSTKLAVFEGEEPLFVESITHSAEELAPYDCVADQYSFRRDLVLDCLKKHYEGSPIVKVLGAEDVAAMGGFVASNALSGHDGMQIMVLGNDERIQLVSLFDNLGKGSSGAALQCLNLMTGVEETTGLNLA